jgi:cellobiose-specific phosphotransferase system component IIC
VGLFHGFVPAERRTLVLLAFVLLAAFLIYFPFLLSPEIGALGQGSGPMHR